MADLGRLVVNLEANIARFTQDMSRASQQTEQAMSQISGAVNVAKVALGALAAAFTVDAIVGQANKAIDALADLDDMAQKTGASVEGLSKLSQVAAMTGTDFGAVDAALVKLAKGMSEVDDKGSKVSKALTAIGISTKGVAAQDPAALFVDIANKLQNYEDGAGKVALAQDLMGKSGADLLPYLNDVVENIERFTGATTEAAEQASAYQDALGLTKAKYDQMVVSIVSAALPATNDFIDALGDVSNEINGVVDIDFSGWADNVALVLARMADGGVLVARTFMAVGASIKGAAANIELMDTTAKNVNPIGAAKVLLNGGNPIANIEAAAAKRNAAVAEAYEVISALWKKPLNAMENAMAGQIEARWYGPASTPEGGGDGKAKNKLNYGDAAKGRAAGGGDAAADIARVIAGLNEETTTRMVYASAIRDSEKALRDFAAAQKYEMDEVARAIQQNESNVEQIRQSLLTDVQAEAEAHQFRLAELQTFHDAKLENVIQANAQIEAETARHAQAVASIQAANDMLALSQAGSAADDMYSLMKKAGEEQSALGRAMFLVNKAIAVAEIIVATNAAAQKAQLEGGTFAGFALSSIISAAGYARAAIVAGTAIASAEGGYDIPAGVNPVTQLHEKEMVLPRAQAEVIRGLAARGGAGGGAGDINQTFNIQIDGSTDMAKNQKMIQGAIQQGNAELVDRLVRAGRI